jgi:O-methyltransferase
MQSAGSPSNARLPSRKELLQADLEAAVEFKRDFFWNAFKALTYNRIEGDYVEFGSHGGTTFRLAFDQIQQRAIKRHMWAFDSFRGLPPQSGPKDEHPVWQSGTMATSEAEFHVICQSHGILRTQYSTVSGFYDDTLPLLGPRSAPRDIALAYVDCDLYSSTKAVLAFLAPRLKHGMILAFDDYFCWSSTQVSGERMAFLELQASFKQWNFVRYRDYGWAGCSYLVEQA